MKKILHLFTKKSRINPWIGIISALIIIIPTLYQILDDTTDFGKKHILLIIGVIVFIKFTKELIDKIIDMSDEYDLYE